MGRPRARAREGAGGFRAPSPPPRAALAEKDRMGGAWRVRRAAPGDFVGLRAAHAGAFPVEYSDSFFAQAAAGHGRLSTWVAVTAPAPAGSAGSGGDGEEGSEDVVGFAVCGRLGHTECGMHDRGELLGLELAHALHDTRELVYILTLGVTEPWRRRGIGRSLLAEVLGLARSLPRCRSVYLHCIHFNHVALAFYGSRGFQLVREIPDFYRLPPDEAPDPRVVAHSAFTLALYLHGGAPPRTLLEVLRGGWHALVALSGAKGEGDGGSGYIRGELGGGAVRGSGASLGATAVRAESRLKWLFSRSHG